MPIVAGIDEAGYGPILGPLSVAGTAFRVPESQVQTDLWHLFRACITREAPRKTTLLRVADSKIVYVGGLAALERSVLPFHRLLHPLPDAIRAFVYAAHGAEMPELLNYPWYVEKDPTLPQALERAEAERCADQLRRFIAAAGGEFAWSRLHLLEASEFNNEVIAANSKAVPLARLVSAIMIELWETFGEEGVWLHVDKQGGRDNYEPFLLANFFGCTIVTHSQSGVRSDYTLRNGRRHMRVVFEPKSDLHYMPVALASMFAKYSRELLMGLLNDYWLRRVPGLKPTAGYRPDGWRFLRDIEEARAREGVATNLLLRCR